MKIYGVAILAACFLAGQVVGESLGVLIGINGNIGGVGFAMIFLIVLNDRLKLRGHLEQDTERGVLFWSAMYIPIVIAMSSTQNVAAALSGGWVALVVGIMATLLCLLLVPLVSRIGKHSGEETTTRDE